jgi:hypothetical protein
VARIYRYASTQTYRQTQKMKKALASAENVPRVLLSCLDEGKVVALLMMDAIRPMVMDRNTG